MSDRTARRVAWMMVALFVVGLGVAIYFGFNPPGDAKPIRLIDALWACSFVGFPVTGALVVGRFPRRALGWIFCAAPCLLVIGLFLGDTGLASGKVDAGTAAWFGWGANVSFSAALVMFTFVPLLLPDGRLASSRWRILLRTLLGIAVVWMLIAMFAPGPLEEFPDYLNPIGISFLKRPVDLIRSIAGPLFLAAFVLALASPIVRFRRAGGHERQQLKWIAFGAGVVLACLLSVPGLQGLFGDLGDVPVTLIIMVAILAFPVSIAIAILRYRLYDIDVIINRTLVYGALTASLLALYLLVVVILSRLLGPITRDSDIAVAASTLAVAALFRPFRSRIQSFIDRRFYRRKYDAARALEDFGTRLREEIAVDVVRSDVLDVVRGTLQPTHASVWIKPEEAL
ncbi:MAG: hypothetical protein ABR505_02970 [Actinomycetota bacterium]